MMSSTRYALYRGRRYYDWTDLDSFLQPTIKWFDFEISPDESDSEPEVGDSWTYQEYGRWYRKTITFVHFRRMVYEDVEGYDVEIYTEEMKDYCPPGCERVDKFLFKAESGHKVLTGYQLGDEDDIELVIPDMVEEIANEAFKDIHRIKSVTIPDSVKVIGIHAFEDCFSITHVDLGHGVETIGLEAFSGCSRLESIALPDSLKSIRWGVFKGCRSLKNVSFPQHTFGIKELLGTFENCSSLEYVELPDTVEKLSHAFRGCQKLQSIRIPAGQKVIEKNEFMHCVSLASVVIPDSVEKIEDWAFYNCKSLKAIEIPASVKYIGRGAFEGCSSLEHVGFLGKLEHLGQDAFKGCPAEIVLPGDRQVFQDLPERLDMYFKDNQLLTSVELPPTVKVIGGGAFYKCKNLVSVKIPDSVTAIDGEAFEFCERLRDIVIPESVTKIGPYAFRGCKSLTYIRIPQSVKEIAVGAFEDVGLVHVEIAGTPEKYQYSFSKCSELTSILVPSTAYHLAFDQCPNIKEVRFSQPLTKITSGAFSGFKAMTSFTIPETVTEICGEAFKNTQITSLVIPESVRKIAYNAFGGSAITEVKWPASMNTITGFCCNYVLKEIVIPDTVTAIGEAAFFQCKSLESLELPEGLTEIGEKAFWYCRNLRCINIPKGVKDFPGFVGCENLKTVLMSRDMYEPYKNYFSAGTDFLFYEDLEG